MAVERPTFSESWYRVVDLKPRLRPTVQSYRQYFRGEEWHVVRDPSNNQFFRVNRAAYRFIALLDGKKTVSQVWQICQEQLGDEAPTQGEAIQTLGQLYGANLLHVELPGDAENLFSRYRNRRNREVRGYILNVLFSRIPVFDPDIMLERWMGMAGWIFTWYGFAVWVVILSMGLMSIFGRYKELWDKASDIFRPEPEHLAMLYLSFVVIKAVHELGHAFSCKKFGMKAHSGGEVHTIGIMFMVFMPMPYVDASSSWTLRSKWERMIVGAAGMYVELACASIAAMIWANTGTGTVAHGIAYNVMFLASVTTVLFNANPLLRFDGYYILSDFLEIPNLGQRSNEFLYYVVKRHVWGVKRATTTVQTFREKFWLLVYCIASFCYRAWVSFSIMLFVSGQFFIVGVVMAIITLIGWMVVPVGKFISYLITSPELSRVRFRAMATTGIFAAAVLGFLGGIPMPDRSVAEGVVEPRNVVMIHMGEPGFIDTFMPTGTDVKQGEAGLVDGSSPELERQKDELLAQRGELEARFRQSVGKKLNEAQIILKQIDALNVSIDRVNTRLDLLHIKAPIKGEWISPTIEHTPGAFMKRGDKLGMVADLDDLIIRVVTDQNIGPRINVEVQGDKREKVQGRVKAAPDQYFTAKIERILPAGETDVPSPALGYQVGGSIQMDEKDPKSGKASEPFFVVLLKPALEVSKDAPHPPHLWSGQRVMVRFELTPKPYAVQWYTLIRQLLQKRFQI